MEGASDQTNNSDRQLIAVANKPAILSYEKFLHIQADSDDEDQDLPIKSLIDHLWSRKIFNMIQSKAALVESFSWLSTIGGGLSSLGERDRTFSLRAGRLSSNQQLKLAERLGDERLKFMCHIFVALAALQLNQKKIYTDYYNKFIRPREGEFHHDHVVVGMLNHLAFRSQNLDKFALNYGDSQQ